MSLDNKFRYDGKRVLVVGGATGMGAAVAELTRHLGAEVIVMDYAPVSRSDVQAIKLNLRDLTSIHSALTSCSRPIDAIFSCAGVAEGTPDIELVNFVGHRFLIEKLIDDGKLSRGSSICLISSSAGLGWEPQFPALEELLNIRDFHESAQWLRTHGKNNYMGTKQAICAYVARQAFEFLKKGIRINGLCPGPTDTPLAQTHQWLSSGTDFREAAGITASSPMEQAYPLAFLCSEAASAITGITLVADLGWFNAGLLHTFPPAAPIAEFLMGRKVTGS